MSIKIKTSNYVFEPKLIPTLLALVCIPVLIALGLWQLDRADEKRVIDKGVSDAITKTALTLNDVDVKSINNEIYRSTLIKGYFDTSHQFLLDNRTNQGKPGYHVISPFLFEHNSSDNSSRLAVLINRGWIAYKGTRDNIIDISLEKEMMSISGAIKHIPRSIVLKDRDVDNSSPSLIFKTEQKQLDGIKLIQSIELERLEKDLNYLLLPVIVELDKTDENGFIREWQPYYGSIDKHNAYALQWFAMASILLFLFFKLNIRKR